MRITLAVLGLSLVACRGSGGGGDDVLTDAPVGAGGSVTIQEVQNPAMAKGTSIQLEGVIVTAIDTFGARTGDLWVEQPGGGEFSGVKVFKAPLDQIATLVPGDIVTISNAQKDEFDCSVAICGSAFRDGLTTTEVTPLAGGTLSVLKTGSGAVPAPAIVDALAIENLPTQAARDAEWEKWEGVLITVTNARQVNDATGFGAKAPDQFNFSATGGVSVQSALAGLGTNGAGTCYAGITGIGDFFFDYLVFPTATDKLVTGGTGCAAQQVTNIAAVQGGTATGSVVLNEVFVSAISFNKKNLWVTQTMTAAPNQGVFVFRGSGTGVAALPANVVVGAKVNILGKTKEQNNDATGDTVTQIESATVQFVTAPAGTPVPAAGQQASALVVAGTGEPFESVLVTLTNVKLNVVGDPTPMTGNFGVGQLQQGATTFLSDDDILLLNDPVGTCYATITGIWTYQVFSNAYGLLPISKTAGGTCQ